MWRTFDALLAGVYHGAFCTYRQTYRCSTPETEAICCVSLCIQIDIDTYVHLHRIIMAVPFVTRRVITNFTSSVQGSPRLALIIYEYHRVIRCTAVRHIRQRISRCHQLTNCQTARQVEEKRRWRNGAVACLVLGIRSFSEYRTNPSHRSGPQRAFHCIMNTFNGVIFVPSGVDAKYDD